MHITGVHYLALDGVKKRVAENEAEYKDATHRLEEALKEGDLRENSPYEIAKADVSRLAKERDELAPVLFLPVVKDSDNLEEIGEGSVVHLTVHSLTDTPLAVGSAEFEQSKVGEPLFDGTLMYGATLNFHELLKDNALSADTPVGAAIKGRLSGDYSVGVPGGFANITVKKLSSSTTIEDLFCKV